ncbi:MAG: aldehyde dehydrogenase family protein [Firmicutes bacterium]|nr:aldehyde dehydrogenase family protein [Bacillota bacterium]
MVDNYRLLIGGQWVSSPVQASIVNPYDDTVVASVPVADRELVDRALQAASDAAREMAALPAHQRYDILMNAARLVEARKEELAVSITRESGKTIRASRQEIERSIFTLRLSAEEAGRIGGEEVRLDRVPGSENRLGFTWREPVGVVACITPFNSPLNLIIHKAGPAIAAGNAVVVKPSPQAPLTGLMLGEILLEAGLPPRALNIVYGGAEVGRQIVTDPRVQFIAFTGSARVGREIASTAGFKKLMLELGSNAGVYVHRDVSIEKVVPRLVQGAFATTGQACISTQRVYVHRDVYEPLLHRFLQAVDRLVVGDPMNPETDIGPMIDKSAAQRVESWVNEAHARGARIAFGGRREGAVVWPTVLVDVQPDMKVVCEEVFGPVVSFIPVGSVEEGVERINDSPYGLQAGVFTEDINVAFRAAKALKVGGVIVNDSSKYRADNMPFGGVKGSGMGRESPAECVRRMTEQKVVVLNLD